MMIPIRGSWYAIPGERAGGRKAISQFPTTTSQTGTCPMTSGRSGDAQGHK